MKDVFMTHSGLSAQTQLEKLPTCCFKNGFDATNKNRRLIGASGRGRPMCTSSGGGVKRSI